MKLRLTPGFTREEMSLDPLNQEPPHSVPPRRYRFGREYRLHGRRAFQAVFAARLRKNMGIISLCARPNDLGHPRLGLSVSRRVGNAVQRHRIKRRLREAFRLTRHDWPDGYDVVVIVYPHEVAKLSEYQRLLLAAIARVHKTWRRRMGADDPLRPPNGREKRNL